MKPMHITITGADENTDIQLMRDLSREYPIEWAILVSADRRGNRYPSHQWIVDQLLPWAGSGLRLALHLCGDLAKAACAGQKLGVDHLVDRGETPLHMFSRIQVNSARYNTEDLEHLNDLQRRLDRPIICQARETTDFQRFGSYGLFALWDQSGGRGRLPRDGWPNFNVIPAIRPVGLAGGLCPENVRQLVGDFGKLCAKTPGYWLDVESGVRDPVTDALNLDLVREFCNQALSEDLPAEHRALLARHDLEARFDLCNDRYMVYADDSEEYQFPLTRDISLRDLDSLLGWASRQYNKGQRAGRNALRCEFHTLLAAESP